MHQSTNVVLSTALVDDKAFIKKDIQMRWNRNSTAFCCLFIYNSQKNSSKSPFLLKKSKTFSLTLSLCGYLNTLALRARFGGEVRANISNMGP